MSENTTQAKPAVKTAAKKNPAVRKPTAAKVVPVNAVKKVKKEKKEETKIKVVRDSFTMPQADYVLIAELKLKALKAGLHIKKSELLRAGLQSLSKLNISQLKVSIAGLEKIKTGRPKKS